MLNEIRLTRWSSVTKLIARTIQLLLKLLPGFFLEVPIHFLSTAGSPPAAIHCLCRTVNGAIIFSPPFGVMERTSVTPAFLKGA